jgi:hypothetical protein
VVGHALGTPTSLVKFASTSEPDYKYSDYMSVFGLEPNFHLARTFLDPERLPRLRSSAHDELDQVSAKVDGVIEGLLTAAYPLR